MNYILTLIGFPLKRMEYVLKMMDFVLKLMGVCTQNDGLCTQQLEQEWEEGRVSSLKNS